MDLDRRPEGVSDATVEALAKVSEAMEWVERARGRLYDLHQMIGRADLLMGDAVDLLRRAGHEEWAERLDREVVGRNVLRGRWTFQIVEDFDGGYWSALREHTAALHAELAGGVRHIHEAEMKADRITPGHPAHRPPPADG